MMIIAAKKVVKDQVARKQRDSKPKPWEGGPVSTRNERMVPP
jgi:hypothetical protein